MASVNPQASLAQVRAWLAKYRNDGCVCPACDQHVKVYRRKIHATMARQLIIMYRTAGTDWFHLPTMLPEARGGDPVKLAYWGLIESDNRLREDGGKAGYWRVTEFGRLFVQNRTEVREYAEVYNGQLLALTGSLVGIREALGSDFSYNELMGESATVSP
jgi:hypothetical protein